MHLKDIEEYSIAEICEARNGIKCSKNKPDEGETKIKTQLEKFRI